MPARPPIRRKMTVASALAAILLAGGVAAAPAAAQTTIDNTNVMNFDNILTSGISDGEIVTIDSGTVPSIDLNGVVTKITASNVTLQGSGSAYDFGADIRAAASALLASPPSSAGSLPTRTSLDGTLGGLGTSLKANKPTTNIYNSAAATGTHGGISASQGGFSLKNLTFEGTVANIDASSGASKYMGLIASTFDRYTDEASLSENGLARDGNGMGLIENVAFLNNVVNTTAYFDGTSNKQVHSVGNTIFFTQRRYDDTGAYVSGQDRIETMEGIKSSLFIGNVSNNDTSAISSVGNRDLSASGVGWVYLKTLESSYFADNAVNGGHHAFGGGLFAYAIGSITDSVFYNNKVASDHDAYGGAVYASGIGDISGSIFVGNEAQGLAYGQGRAAGALGGAINASGATNQSLMDDPVNLSGINSIANSLFAYNRAYNSTGEEAQGGAVNVARNFNTVSDSVFYGNSVESNGDAYGGAISVNVNQAGMATTITDSLFYANSVDSDGTGTGGAISFNMITADATGYTLNLAATAGGLTEFSGNTVNGVANSLYFGRHDSTKDSQTDAVLNIRAATGGTVALLDPITVDFNNGKTFNLVNHDTGGTFIWDGINNLSADGGSFITLETDSTTIFKEGFHLHNGGSGNDITITLESGADLVMVLSGRNQNMALFEDATIINQGASLSAHYYGFTDQTGTWVLSDNASGAQATDLEVTNVVDPNTSASADIKLTYDNEKTYINIGYKAPTLPFFQASPNAESGRYALQGAWENILVPSFGADVGLQAAYFDAILSELNNYTAEAFASQATIGLSTSYNIANQAITSNQRSWFSAKGPNQPSFGDSEGQVRIWADFIGARIDQDSRNKYSGYDVTNKGAVFGLSYDSGHVWSFGGYMSVSDGNTDYDDIAAEIDTNIFQGGLFASYKAVTNGFGATLDVSYAKMENDSTRRFIGDRYEADFDQTVFGVGLDLSYEFNPWENGSITPFLNARYQSLDQDSFREYSGTGLLPLHVRSADGDSFTTVLGAKLEHNFQFENTVLTPRLSLGWRHEFGDRDISTAYDIAGATLVTRANSVEAASNAFDLGASFTLVPLKCGNGADFGINAGYNASISSDRVEHNFYGGLEVKF